MDMIEKKEFGCMVGVKGDSLVNVPLEQVAQGPRCVRSSVLPWPKELRNHAG
jgi:hypothetical protein